MMPPHGMTCSAKELIVFRSLSAKHVTFSLTETCNLKCKHCVISSAPVASKERTLPMSDAQNYAKQLPQLWRQGVKFVGFTGGEPLMAPEQLSLLSKAAFLTGMQCGIVTSCDWATSKEAIERVVKSFPSVSHWGLSTDVFHQEFVPLENVLQAAKVILSMERTVTLRMAVSDSFTEKQLSIYNDLKTRLPGSVPILIQHIIRMGRGISLNSKDVQTEMPYSYCIPTGMAIHYDGTISPCCCRLFVKQTEHPFQYGNANDIGLAKAHNLWCTDPLLQLMRGAGLTPLLQWLADAHKDNEILTKSFSHPCDLCIELWKDPCLREELRRRAELPEIRKKTADLNEALFGERYMKQDFLDNQKN